MKTSKNMKSIFVIIMALVVLYCQPGAAAETPAPAGLFKKWFGPGSLTLQFENDRIANTDRHYTHGTRLSWISEPNEERPVEFDMVPALLNPFDDRDRGTNPSTWRTGIALGQNIYTPENIARADVIEDDRPYAGWLYMGLSLYNEKRRGPGDNGWNKWDKLNTWEFDIGIVGPQSYAEDVQTIVHNYIGVTRPNGWDHQLKNEPGLALHYEWKFRHRARLFGANDGAPVLRGLTFDLMPHYGVSVGNVDTGLRIGGMIRAGYNMPDDFGAPHIRPNLSGPGYIDTTDEAGFYLFAGVEQRAVLRNIFLDGNTFATSHSVTKRPFVSDFSFGGVVVYGRASLAYTHVIRTREFAGQSHPDRFGSISLSFNL